MRYAREIEVATPPGETFAYLADFTYAAEWDPGVAEARRLTPDPTTVATGAEMRRTGDGPTAVVCVNGGQGAEVEGTWSASLEWLVARLAPQFPKLAFAEVRYRIKSWKRMDDCIADARAAVREVGA